VKQLLSFLRPILFFLLVFTFYRVAFMVLYPGTTEKTVSIAERLPALWYGLRLDLAVGAYVQVIPLLLWLVAFPRITPFLQRFLHGYYAFVIAVITLESVANLAVYRYWDTLLNWRALSYLAEPREMLASVSLPVLVVLLVALVLLYVASWKSFRRIFFRSFLPPPASVPARLGLSLLLPVLLLGAARGGWQLLPVNESVAYYSGIPQLNDAAVNSLWHLGHSAKVSQSTGNPFRVMADQKAGDLTGSLLRTGEDTVRLLSVRRPNVVLLILESYSADLLGCMGGQPSAAPFLDSLAGQGLLFTGIYSSGFRTDQGLTALLSGFPATPLFSVIRYPEKSAALPSLVKQLADAGYASSYYYGGAGNFRNMKAYCFNLGFGRFTDKENYDASLPRSKWGVHDEYVLLRQAKELRVEKQPFFSAVMTLSNHEPYDVPMPVHFSGSDNASQFRNSAYYTDRSLKKYFESVRREPWYDSTLFILVADHGHHLPARRDMSGPEAHHLPLIFFGNALRPEWRGVTVGATGNHHDLPATLLAQLGLPHGAFPWSRDLLAGEAHPFAYYEQEDGFGWIKPGGWLYFSVLQKKIILRSDSLHDEARMIRDGSAYLQTLYDSFLKF
jgi:phosphoglycerol transferase MdoB-like AlkP superfamily enzyme